MASATQTLTDFAQDVYLMVKGRDFDDISSDDGQTFLVQMARWANMFVDELESETGPSGKNVDWWFSRSEGYDLGSVPSTGQSLDLPSAVNRLTTDEERYVQITDSNGVVQSNWLVVHPKDISSKSERNRQDMCAVVGSSLVFSRAFTDSEANGVVTADVILSLPRVTYTINGTGQTIANNVRLFSTVQPLLLLKLGVAKNVSLPDIVQGKLSPSYSQKFTDLLQGAIARSEASAAAPVMARDSFSNVRGV